VHPQQICGCSLVWISGWYTGGQGKYIEGPRKPGRTSGQNSMKIFKGKCKSRPLGWTKPYSITGWGQLSGRTSAVEVPRTPDRQCLCAAI